MSKEKKSKSSACEDTPSGYGSQKSGDDREHGAMRAIFLGLAVVLMVLALIVVPAVCYSWMLIGYSYEKLSEVLNLLFIICGVSFSLILIAVMDVNANNVETTAEETARKLSSTDFNRIIWITAVIMWTAMMILIHHIFNGGEKFFIACLMSVWPTRIISKYIIRLWPASVISKNQFLTIVTIVVTYLVFLVPSFLFFVEIGG